MRTLILLLCLVPSFALAQSSIAEFTVLNDGGKGIQKRYRIVLDDRDPRKDEVLVQGHAEVWTRVYQGAVTKLELPKDARIDMTYGDRIASVFKTGNYSLEDHLKSAGLRLRSGVRLVFITPFGAADVPWPGEVQDAVQLNRDADFHFSTSYYMFSVKGQYSSNTYMVLNGEYDMPLKMMDGFRAEPFNAVMEEGVIRVAELNKSFVIHQVLEDARMMKNGRAQAQQVPFKDIEIPREVADIIRGAAAPSASAVMDELIAMLDQREVLLSMPNAEAMVRKAVREMLVREFPRLVELEKTDRVVGSNVDKVVSSLSNLWLAHKAVSGTAIHRTLIQRLEAAMDNRAKCELSVTTLKGEGSHAASYYRSIALSSLNTLYQKLYKN